MLARILDIDEPFWTDTQLNIQKESVVFKGTLEQAPADDEIKTLFQSFKMLI